MSRQFAVAALLLLLSTPLFASSLRSDKHFVKIEVQSLAGASRQYNVQVFDAESRNHVAHLKVTTTGDRPNDAETTAGGMRYKVRVEPHGNAYLVAFAAQDGAELIDTMRGGFTHVAAPDAPRARPARAGREVDEPALLRRIEPLYTEEAKTAGAAGTVVLEVLIDKSGFVRDAKVLKPMGYGLDEAAVDAVKGWQYAPSMRGNAPVEVVHEVVIELKP